MLHDTLFARQAGELKIPAAFVGINVESQKDGFWAATQGKGNFAVSLSTFVRDVAYNDLTLPFIEKYISRFGGLPTYTAVTYDAIKSTLGEAITEALHKIYLQKDDPRDIMGYFEKPGFVWQPNGKPNSWAFLVQWEEEGGNWGKRTLFHPSEGMMKVPSINPVSQISAIRPSIITLVSRTL
jgi:hypothetical protein